MDASALIAYLREEASAGAVEAALLAGNARLSTVNRTEAKGKLVGSGGYTPQEVDDRLAALQPLLALEPFD